MTITYRNPNVVKSDYQEILDYCESHKIPISISGDKRGKPTNIKIYDTNINLTALKALITSKGLTLS